MCGGVLDARSLEAVAAAKEVDTASRSLVSGPPMLEMALGSVVVAPVPAICCGVLPEPRAGTLANVVRLIGRGCWRLLESRVRLDLTPQNLFSCSAARDAKSGVGDAKLTPFWVNTCVITPLFDTEPRQVQGSIHS